MKNPVFCMLLLTVTATLIDLIVIIFYIKMVDLNAFYLLYCPHDIHLSPNYNARLKYLSLVVLVGLMSDVVSHSHLPPHFSDGYPIKIVCSYE